MARLAVTLILVALAALLGFFYLVPAWREFQDTRAETAALEAISRELDDLIQNRDTLIAAINTISGENLLRMERALPQGADTPTLLAEFERLARSRGLAVKRLDVTGVVESLVPAAEATPRTPRPGGETRIPPPRAAGAIRELPLTLQIFGGYEGFKGFLGDLERSLRIMDVTDTTFSSPQRADAPFDITLKVKTYHQ